MKKIFSFQGKLMMLVLIIIMVTFTILNVQFSEYKEWIAKGYIIILLLCIVWLNILAYKDTQNQLGLVVIKIIMYSGVVISLVLNQIGLIEFADATNIFTSFVVVSEIASLIREFIKKRKKSSQNYCEDLYEKDNNITNCKLENVTITNYKIIGCSSVKACTITGCII